MLQTVRRIIKIPQFVDTVADVPVVRVVQILTCRLWMRQSFSHSSYSLRKSLRSPDVDDIPVVAQMRLPMVLQTIEIPQLHVDMAPMVLQTIEIPVARGHGDPCPWCAGPASSTGAVVEETVELPRLHSLRNSSSGAAHHRVDELME